MPWVIQVCEIHIFVCGVNSQHQTSAQLTSFTQNFAGAHRKFFPSNLLHEIFDTTHHDYKFWTLNQHSIYYTVKSSFDSPSKEKYGSRCIQIKTKSRSGKVFNISNYCDSKISGWYRNGDKSLKV